MTWRIIFDLLILWACYNIVIGKPFCKKKIITRGNNEAYLVRYSFLWLTCKWWAVKVHHILLSDDACLHDHPWCFLSLILRGGYTEQRMIRSTKYLTRTAIYYGPGSLLYRKAQSTHRLILTKPAWTLVITFKKFKSWGFYTPNGFINWREYNEDGGCETENTLDNIITTLERPGVVGREQ